MKKNNILYLVIFILIIWNLFLTFNLFSKNNKYNDVSIIKNNVQGFSTDLSKVVDKCKSSIVLIETSDSISSGFIYKKIDNKVYIVTSYHSVDGSSYVNVFLANNKKFEGTIKGYDILADIAIIEINVDFNVNEVTLSNATLLNAGEFIISIGSPISSEYDNSVSQGIVSNKLRIINNSITYEDEKYDYYTGLIQLNINVLEGYSGAPVFNMDGQIVGVITMKNDVATFAIPINEVNYIVNNIINGEDYDKNNFEVKGDFISDLEIYDKNSLNIKLDVIEGLYVSNVKKGSFAESLGINVGDIIVSINNTILNDYDDLLFVEYSNETNFELKIIRNNEDLVLKGSK